jgi:hypothetical protein
MALISCPECGHDVSDSAVTCPNCGFRLKKQKKFKHKGIIALLIIIGCFAGWVYYFMVSKPEVYIKDFMAKYKVSVDDWKLNFGEVSETYSNAYIWENIELIEDIKGRLTLFTYDSKLDGWRWRVIGDEKVLSKIRTGLTRISSASDEQIVGYDAGYTFKWVEYAEENIGIGDWTRDDKPITVEMVQGDYHQLVLLKKGDVIEIQYLPLNRDIGLSTNYYTIDED